MAESHTPGASDTSRPAELIRYCQNTLIKHLLAYITPVFDNTQEALFEMAEAGVDTATQNRLLESQRVLRNRKTSFTERFNEALNESFDRFRQRQKDGSLQPADPAASLKDDLPSHDQMSLVEETDLEETLAISDMVSKAEVRFTQSIYALNQRLAILSGGRPVKNDSNPCGPLMIGQALRSAAETLPIDVGIKVKLFHRFDRLLQKNIDGCYEEINEHLIKAGILPNIRFEAQKRPRSVPPPSPEGPSQDSEDSTGTASQGARAAAPTAPRSRSRSVPASPGDQSDFFGRVMAASQPGAGADSSAMDSAEPSSAGLRQLLSRIAGGTGAPTGPVAKPPRVQNALSNLQQRLAGGRGGGTAQLGIDEIKRNLTESLGTDPETGKPMALGERENQTIDVMGMLYEHIHSENALQQTVQGLLHKLMVPMIRVAIQEDRFFDDREHPARRFFNSVAEAGELWMDDDPHKSPTFDKMQTAIDRVLDEYQGDNEVFKDLLSDLDKHIRLLSRKATLAEKRHVEAARGQEKLEKARERARHLIGELVRKYKPPKFVESVLSQPWADVLALTVLRHGDDSEEWRQALTVAKTLIFSVRDDLDEKVRENLRKRTDWLRKELTRGLSQVGFFEQDIDSLLANLDACHRWSLAPEKVEEQPAALSKPLDAPETPVAKSQAPKPAKVKPELSESEKAMLAKIRLLPFGTWFEIRFEPEGEWVKRKLSWFSPLSGRCLFVNNRGAVAEEVSLNELAQRMAAETARVFRPSNRPLLDRAMDAIFGRLKKLASKASPAAG